MFSTTHSISRRGLDVPGRAKAKTIVAAAMGAAFVLLCACVTRPSAPEAPTHPLPAPATATPAGPTPPVSVVVASPSPEPGVVPPEPPPTDSLTANVAGSAVTDLAIVVAGPAQVTSGDSHSYTLAIHNRGASPATGIVLTGVLPTGMVPLWIEPGQPVCRRQEGSVDCDLGELRSGMAFTVTLDLTTGGTEALVTGTQLAGVTLDLPIPSCVLREDYVWPHFTCRLTRLLPGASAQVLLGVGADSLLSGTLVLTAVVEANEADEDHSNNSTAFTSTVTMVRPDLIETEGTETTYPHALTTDLELQAAAPSAVIAGLPFTYAYTVTNRGTSDASGVRFQNTVPPATILNSYAPNHPPCEWLEDSMTCYMSDLATGDTITVTLVVTGHSGQQILLWLDQLLPGWPICYLLKERDYLHIVICELGVLRPGQTTHVRVGFTAIGLQERLMVNAASVSAVETEVITLNNTSTTTITVQARADLAVWSVVSGPAPTGGAFSYTLAVANLGPSDSANVLLTDTLPIGASVVSILPSLGLDCMSGPDGTASDTVLCRAGRLNGGETATVTVTFAIGDSLVGEPAEPIVHSARVTADQIDPDTSNNQLTEYIVVSTRTED